MDELVKAISEKSGLPEAQAAKAAEAAVEFMKEKAPAPMQGMIDKMLSGEGGGGGMAGAAGMLGGLMGKK